MTRLRTSGDYAHAFRRQHDSAEPLEQDQHQHSSVHSRPKTCRALPGNYTYTNLQTTDDYIWTLKLDHAITQKNRIAFWLSQENQLTATDQYWPGPLSNGLLTYQLPDNYRVNDDHIFKPTVLLHTTWGFTRQIQNWTNPLQNGFASKIGLPLTGKADATPIIAFKPILPMPGGLNGGYTTWGMNQGKVDQGGQRNWTTHVTQQLSWVQRQARIQDGLGHPPPAHFWQRLGRHQRPIQLLPPSDGAARPR